MNKFVLFCCSPLFPDAVVVVVVILVVTGIIASKPSILTGIRVGSCTIASLSRLIGWRVIITDGSFVDISDNLSVGFSVGFSVGRFVGRWVGVSVDVLVGKLLGFWVGICVGRKVGFLEGCAVVVGLAVGFDVALGGFAFVGDNVLREGNNRD